MNHATIQERGFLQAILANPDDDTPRLIFADWLDEYAEKEVCGRCYGEKSIGVWDDTMRVPCDVCRGTGYVGGAKAEWAEQIRCVGVSRFEVSSNGFPNSLCETGREQFNKNAVVAIIQPYSWIEKVFIRRGFIEEIICSSVDWFNHADQITSQHPIRVVRLIDIPKIEICWHLAGACYQFKGREYPWIYRPQPAGLTAIDVAKRLLHEGWPAITFHLLEEENNQ